MPFLLFLNVIFTLLNVLGVYFISDEKIGHVLQKEDVC